MPVQWAVLSNKVTVTGTILVDGQWAIIKLRNREKMAVLLV
jgi:hypothetical protein